MRAAARSPLATLLLVAAAALTVGVASAIDSISLVNEETGSVLGDGRDQTIAKALAAEENQRITVEGTLVIGIRHTDEGVIFNPGVMVNGTVEFPIIFTKIPNTKPPPEDYVPGARVLVEGQLRKEGIKVRKWGKIEVLSASIAGDLKFRVRDMKTLYLHMVSDGANNNICGRQQSVKEVDNMMTRIQNLFSECSKSTFNYNLKTSKVVNNIPISCGSCDGNFLEQQRQKAFRAARAQGIEPNSYPFHFFAWPQYISERCFPGQAFVGCYGHDGWNCRAEVAYPWTNDIGSVVHEIGHQIGLQHATASPQACSQSEYPNNVWLGCGSGEYGDQTSPMGLNLAANCYNLPQQHFLGWTKPERTLTDKQMPFGKVITVKLAPLTTSRTAGLRVAIPGFHAVYADFLVKDGGRQDMLDWWKQKVALYSFEWDGVTFKPGFYSSTKSVFLGALSHNWDKQVLSGSPLPNLVFKRIWTGTAGKRVTFNICRYRSNANECRV